MKRSFQIFFTAFLSMNLILSPALAAPLEPMRIYEDAGFTDVSNDWSLPYISVCYELGLMSGQGNCLFGPNSPVSVAEGITVSARLHSLWQGGSGIFSNEKTWYDGAVQYALEKNIYTEGEFSDYTNPITRRRLAGLLAKTLPPEDYAPINSVYELPDVSMTDPYAKEIFDLYNAGILTGTDSFGTFSPDASITRAELAAILCRLVRPETRQAFSLPHQENDPASLTILFFHATWCKPCRLLAPVIDQLAEQYRDQGVVVQKIDVDVQPKLAEQYGINSYPTVIFLRDGQELERHVGSTTLDAYQNMLSQWL